MDRLALEKIKEILLKNDRIDIVVCKNPNIDQMGGALGLYLSLMQSGKNASIVCPTEPIVEIASLVGIDKVKKNFAGEAGDLIVSFPYKEGEIEKISYTLENGALNIIVKAGEKGLSFDKNDIQYKRGNSASKVIFVVGASKLSDLGSFSEMEALKDTIIINIDNKANNQGFGDIVLVKKSSSISEEIANFIFSLNLKLDTDVCQNLLSGICNATDNFQNPNTSPFAFEIGAVLMRNGAVRNGNQEIMEPIKIEEASQKTFAKPSFTEQKKQAVNPPEDWLTPKIYKGSTNV